MEDKKYLLVLSKISNRYKTLQHVSAQLTLTFLCENETEEKGFYREEGRAWGPPLVDAPDRLPLVVAPGASPLVAPGRPPLVVAPGRPPLPPLSNRPVKSRHVSRFGGTRFSGRRFVVK